MTRKAAPKMHFLVQNIADHWSARVSEEERSLNVGERIEHGNPD